MQAKINFIRFNKEPATYTEGDKYIIHDLILDLWIDSQGNVTELDWDEFDGAVKSGFISNELRQNAIETLERLKREIVQGTFPSHYIR